MSRAHSSATGRRLPPLSGAVAVLVVLLFLTFLGRAVGLDQPIVENYVGRQIPTAMVARNLERGSGFLRPRLDTVPLPNFFLIEPPVYAGFVVGFRHATGFPLTWSGRLVSALATSLAAWGLFGLVRRREGTEVALLAVAAFAVFPVTVRYGRAFQPDALMLGLVLAGLRSWDEHEAGGGPAWLAFGSVLLAAGLAVKVTAASILVPLVAAILRPRRAWKVGLACALLLPALVWYLHAAALIAGGVGSRAAADNQAIWLRVLSPALLWRPDTARAAGHLIVRSFTPIGLTLAVWGLCRPRVEDRFWLIWGASAASTLVVLAAKLHHEYYFLALAPVAAVGVGKGLVDLRRRGRLGKSFAAAAASSFLALAWLQSASTWRTPSEWVGLPSAARAVGAHVPPGAWVAAPEALLFASDRRGCRLEFSRPSALRAAGEWGQALAGNGPLALLEFYRERGARFVADVGDAAARGDRDRLALHEAIRRRYNVIVDRSDVLLAELNPPGGALDGNR